MTDAGVACTSPGDPVVLDAHQPRSVEAYLHRRGWIAEEELVERVEVAGPGNMNLVLRIVTPVRSVVVKQGHRFVARYPHIAAPWGRTGVEAQWYQLASKVPALARRLPRLLGVDPANQVLVLSDLGPAADCTSCYAGERLGDEALGSLVAWLATLHQSFRGDDAAARIENRDMRRLNHEHLFEVPLCPDNGLDLDALTPGLSGLAEALRSDSRLRDATAALGTAYLGEGTTLLHGDYYPGSWLSSPDGPYVIDPEFGFFGLAEIDVGVMLAHLELSGHPAGVAAGVLHDYRSQAGLDVELTWAFCGVEVIRRLLGVAQLPLAAGVEEKKALLDRAVERVRAAG